MAWWFPRKRYWKSWICWNAAGVNVTERLKISEACPLILAHHIALDQHARSLKVLEKLVQQGVVLAHL